MIEKLVRDEPGRRIRAEGGMIRVAHHIEMPLLLARKLVEEAQELLAHVQDGADGEDVDLIAEFADVSEVFERLRNSLSVNNVDVAEAQWAKAQREGVFSERLVWKKS